jgi:hypothetical protein
MSTRGSIAAGTLRHWRGVYNHFDSFPTGLGKDLYEHVTRRMLEGKTLAEIGSDILCFDDWRNYLKGGICEYCGKMTGQAHSISGAILGKPPGKYPDPKAKHHSHQSLENVAQIQFTPQDLEDSDLEWVYILDPAAQCIHVLSLRERRKHVGDLRFDAVPDFDKIECGDELERCHHYAWHHFPEIDQQGPQSRLGTQHYLGWKPLRRLDDACAFEHRGKRYRRTGSGVHGAYARRCGIAVDSPDIQAWYESVIGEHGATFYLAVGRIGKREHTPYSGVTWIFPPTKANPVETRRCRE